MPKHRLVFSLVALLLVGASAFLVLRTSPGPGGSRFPGAAQSPGLSSEAQVSRPAAGEVQRSDRNQMARSADDIPEVLWQDSRAEALETEIISAGPSQIAIQGVVLNSQTVSPVVHARVIVSGELLSEQETGVGPDGHFRLVVPSAPGYSLHASAEGFRDYRNEGLIAGDRTVVETEILMDPLIRLAGWVLDHRSRGIPEATVAVSLLEGGEKKRISNAVTDASGSFSFDTAVSRPGLYQLEASRLGFDLVSPVQAKLPDEDEVRIYMRPSSLADSSVVWGQVRNCEGAPLSGAEVRLVERPSNMGLQAVKTDADGFYQIERIGKGQYLMIAEAEGYARPTRHQTKHFSVDFPREYRFDFVLDPETAIEGTVVDEQNRPVDRAMVQLRFEKGAGLGAFTSSEGNFRLERVPPGRHTLKILHRDFLPYEALVAAPVGERLQITLQGGLVFRGILNTSEGAPVEKFSFSFVSARTGQQIKRVRFTAVDGRFEAKGLPPGDYELRLELPERPTASVFLGLQQSLEVLMLLNPAGSDSPIFLEVIRYLSP